MNLHRGKCRGCGRMGLVDLDVGPRGGLCGNCRFPLEREQDLKDVSRWLGLAAAVGLGLLSLAVSAIVFFTWRA